MTNKRLAAIEPLVGQLLMSFAERSSDVFWIRSPDFKTQLYLSPSFEEVWERTIESLYEYPDRWFEYLHPEDRDQLSYSASVRDETLSNPKKVVHEYRIIRPDNSIRWIRDRSFPIYGANNELLGFAGAAQDITKEKDLERAEAQAKIANQAKSEFIASMSHDLRTPLNWLLSSAELLRKRNNDPYQHDLIDMIVDGSQRVLHMVEEILEYSRLESGKCPANYEPFNLLRMLEEVSGLMSNEANKRKLRLILDYPENVARHLVGDGPRMRRILMNLLSNALKFTKTGHISVRISEVPAPNPDSKKKVWLNLEVTDTGIGIPADRLDAIFERFEKIEPSYRSRFKGIGLGLSIVKSFVEAMDGKIEVTSTLNQGSTFTCTLPFDVQEVQNKGSIWLRHFNNVPVLFIDDYEIRGQNLAKQAGHEHCSWSNSTDSLSVLHHAADEQNPFAIIVIDNELTECCPYQLCEQISKESHFQQPMILLTKQNNDNDPKQEQEQEQRFFGVVNKPVPPSLLVKALANYWSRWQSIRKSPRELLKEFNCRVLLVEDEPFGQKIVSMLLSEELFCKVDIAECGESAIELFNKNIYDLILMDIGLPDISGFEITKRIRQKEDKSNPTVVVALTAHASDQIQQELVRSGIDSYISKPATFDDLLNILTEQVLFQQQQRRKNYQALPVSA